MLSCLSTTKPRLILSLICLPKQARLRLFIPPAPANLISALSYANAFPTKKFAGFRLPSTFIILSQSKLSKDKIKLSYEKIKELECIGIYWDMYRKKESKSFCV